MIEHIRKYSGLTIVILVVIFISFFFMDTSSMRGMSGSPTVMRIDGRGYTEKEFRRLGAGASELIMGTARSGDFGLYQAFMPLFGARPTPDSFATSSNRLPARLAKSSETP